MKIKVILLSLLLLYITIIAVAQKDDLWSDEWRYIEYATNLSHGDYLPNYKDYLWNGPGYPVFLLPFILLKTPIFFIRLMNSLLLLAAVYYFYLTLRLYISDRHALFFTCLYAIYPPFLRYIHFMLTEVIAVFLVSFFLYYFCRLYREEKNTLRNMVLSSGAIGYLALTKIFFGYVILVLFLLYLSLYIIRRTEAFKKTMLVYILSIMFCIPYLIYTYSVTGRIYYWGNSGGSSLYWMSTPYENELGDWLHWEQKMKNNKQLFENHHEFLNSLENFSYTERDDKFKKQAIKNIIDNPLKFIENWLANVGRLLFNYPYSYTEQKLSTYFFLIPNMFIVVFIVVCCYPAFLGRRLIPYEIYSMMLFGLVSFFGSSLLSAYNRQFWPLFPVFFFWIAFVLSRIMKIEVKQ